MQGDIERLRARLRDGRAGLFGGGVTPGSSRGLLSAYSRLVDGVVQEIFEISCSAADKRQTRGTRSALTILATGGYGRRELNPFSDIDIAFVPSEEEDSWVEAAVHVAFKLVMDVFLTSRDLQVGYSFRPVAEIDTWDLATLTALLDGRFLCGDPAPADSLRRALRRTLSPLDLVLEVRGASHDQGVGGASLYCVEPSLKEGPGSLRDLHRGRWVFKLLLGVEDDDLLPALVAKGYLGQAEAEAVDAAAAWFWDARTWLHLVSGRRSDVIIGNHQDRIARDFGAEGSQEWLSRHYAHAEALLRFREAAVRGALRGPVHLGVARVRDGHIELAEAGEPADSTVRVVHLAQRYSLPLSAQTHAILLAANRNPSSSTAPPEERWSFLRVLNESEGVASAIRRLLVLGALDRHIPGYAALMRFAPPDPSHRYTVGEHSIRIVEHLERLRERADPREGRFSELLAGCAHFDVLVLAALLHDAGKMTPGTDHSVSSAEMAKETAERLQLAPEKSRLLTTLVLHHLLLVRTARLQDLKTPAVIQRVAEQCETPEALRHLYVFSYVDTRAVGGNSWTSMDFRDLEELCVKAQDYLEGRSAEAADSGAVKDRIGRIHRRLAGESAVPEDAILRHCDSMPASYILNTPLEEISLHLQLLSRLDSEGVVLDVYSRPGDDYSELTICAYDDPAPGMLAKITGVLYGCNTDIHRARVFTMEQPRPVVLDTLWVRSAGHQLSENRVRRLRAGLRAVLLGEERLEMFLGKAGKLPPAGIPLDSIVLRNDLSPEHTVVHVVARDLQGLLFLMTRALSRCGLDIHSARVATWNARAENNFHVTAGAGGQVPGGELPSWQERLSRALLGLDAGGVR